MDVRDIQFFTDHMSGKPGIPVMAIDKRIGKFVFLNKAEGIFYPFRYFFIKVFFWNKIFTSAGHANNAYIFIYFFNFRLVFKAPGPYIDLSAELGYLF